MLSENLVLGRQDRNFTRQTRRDRQMRSFDQHQEVCDEEYVV